MSSCSSFLSILPRPLPFFLVPLLLGESSKAPNGFVTLVGRYSTDPLYLDAIKRRVECAVSIQRACSFRLPPSQIHSSSNQPSAIVFCHTRISIPKNRIKPKRHKKKLENLRKKNPFFCHTEIFVFKNEINRKWQ